MAATVEIWQTKYYTTNERLSFLYNNEELADFHFKVGPEKVLIPAHKLLLSMTSQFFSNIFYLIEIDTKELEIPEDVTPDIFKEFLKYFYGIEVLLTIDNVGIIIKLSKDYNLPQLEEQCVLYIKTNLDEDKVFDIFDVAISCDFPILKDFCMEMIADNAPHIFNQPTFLIIKENLLKLIINSELLFCSEYDVFKATLEWALNQCKLNNLEINNVNIRQMLGDLIYFIRFSAMKTNEFIKCIGEFNFLSNEEIGIIFQSIELKDKTTNKFIYNQRDAFKNLETMEIKSCNRFTQLKENFSIGGTIDVIFSVSKKVFCSGYSYYGRTVSACHEFGKQEVVKIQLFSNINSLLIGEQTSTINYDGSNKTYEIHYNKPILLKPNTEYKAVLIREGQPEILKNYGGIDGALTYDVDGITFTFKNIHAEPTNLTTEGIISSILFKN